MFIPIQLEYSCTPLTSRLARRPIGWPWSTVNRQTDAPWCVSVESEQWQGRLSTQWTSDKYPDPIFGQNSVSRKPLSVLRKCQSDTALVNVDIRFLSSLRRYSLLFTVREMDFPPSTNCLFLFYGNTGTQTKTTTPQHPVASVFKRAYILYVSRRDMILSSICSVV